MQKRWKMISVTSCEVPELLVAALAILTLSGFAHVRGRDQAPRSACEVLRCSPSSAGQDSSCVVTYFDNRAPPCGLTRTHASAHLSWMMDVPNKNDRRCQEASAAYLQGTMNTSSSMGLWLRQRPGRTSHTGSSACRHEMVKQALVSEIEAK